jgi:hypothetical protein
MTTRWAGLTVCLLVALSGLFLATACDPCASCSGEASPTATPTQAANGCLPSSSLGVLVSGTNATVYAPQGNWADIGGGTSDSVKVVPIETSGGLGTGGSSTTIQTPNLPNSCSSNSKTGETVCVGNNTDVYLINGTTLTNTLTSGSDATEGFSGGACNNCGVVVDSSTDRALIAMGLGSGAVGGYQFLDLGSGTFETPIPAGTTTSEDIAIDPIRHLILSPNESSIYQLVNIKTSTPALFNNDFGASGEPDSAGEDCTTGIALSTIEDTNSLFIADLTQAKFVAGTPGTWTDTASQIQSFPEFDPIVEDGAGTCGIAVAPNTHLGIVTGEFGGNVEGVIQLPSKSGSGVPAVVDDVVFTMPTQPDESSFQMGFDPHTVTAYVSPNSKKALAVLENSDFSFLAVVDLQGLLNAPRTGHVVNEPLPAGLVTYIAE